MAGIRVTGGAYKGRRLSVARGSPARYTSSKVRQAVFDLLGDIEGMAVLDLFAGAGSFAVEALSRGAASLVAVEKERRTASLLAANLKDLAPDKDCLVVNMDVRYAVPMLGRQGRRFDVIFADPPYEMGYIALLPGLVKAGELCRDNGVLVLEHSKREAAGAPPGYAVRTKRYGDTLISVLACAYEEEPAR
jgi:16S rRNA (guanine(966)-N(2))-methyltransferase RsmD